MRGRPAASKIDGMQELSQPVRAAIVREFGAPQTVEEVELRAPGPGEVLVRVEAAAFCITDALSTNNGFTLGQPPLISGHAAAGVVEAVGPDVQRTRVGDRVVVAGSTECGTCYCCVRGQPGACDQIIGGMIPPRHVARTHDGLTVTADGGIGVFAERMVHREIQLVAVDSDMPAEQLCMLGCGITSGLGAVFNIAQVEPGATVAICGCGHLGLWMIQAARLTGAARIIAIEPSPNRRALAGELGATDLVDPADADPSSRSAASRMAAASTTRSRPPAAPTRCARPS
jgi:S-(hydroxymethyl)glutathione dehydrogenase/alcohol dehydrogenase